MTELLEICAPLGAKTLAQFAMLPNPITSFYQAIVENNEIFGCEFRALQAVELAFIDGDIRQPHLIGRDVRTLDSESVLLVIWRQAWAAPSFPPPRLDQVFEPQREFPGKLVPADSVKNEIKRGVPETQARFTTEWGCSGPAHLDQALDQFDSDRGFGPQAVGEAWLADVLDGIRSAAEGQMGAAHEQWELDLHRELGEKDISSIDHIRPLATLGSISGLLREARDVAAEPYDHAEMYWFTKTDNSRRIEVALEEIDALLDRFGTRLRDSIALASAVSSATALQIQQRTQRQSESLQAAVTTIGSLVLGPTLVFGAFGANVPLPLGSTWWGLAAMILAAMASIIIIRKLLNRMANSYEGK